MKPTHVSESQAIANARTVLGRVEVVYVQNLEAGLGIDEGFDDRPEQTEYNCFISDGGELTQICTIYERNGRILGYYPYKPTGHCYDCGMVFCHEDGKESDHPELESLYEALTNSDAEFRNECGPNEERDCTLMCDYCKPLDLDPALKKRYGVLIATVLHQAAQDMNSTPEDLQVVQDNPDHESMMEWANGRISEYVQKRLDSQQKNK